MSLFTRLCLVSVELFVRPSRSRFVKAYDTSTPRLVKERQYLQAVTMALSSLTIVALQQARLAALCVDGEASESDDKETSDASKTITHTAIRMEERTRCEACTLGIGCEYGTCKALISLSKYTG